jgi:hypothetical protein
MIQSVLVAHDFFPDVIEYAMTRNDVEERSVRLISYRLMEDEQEIRLAEEVA